MKTSKTSTQLNIEDELMFLAGDSPANRLALQENEKEQRMNATCGQRCLELSESVNPVGSWARTFGEFVLGRTDWFSKRVTLTWKILGTPSNRLLFQLVPQTLPTDATEFGLLPTVKTTDHHKQRTLNEHGENVSHTTGTKYGLHLTQLAESEMLPTPTAQQERANASIDRGKGNLSDEVATRFQVGGKSSQLSPLFVEEMMGFPKNWTALPFQSGEENQ
jgi:hypothetical protein